jgi:6-pyruvoyl-tetrahydropterin synthase
MPDKYLRYNLHKIFHSAHSVGPDEKIHGHSWHVVVSLILNSYNSNNLPIKIKNDDNSLDLIIKKLDYQNLNRIVAFSKIYPAAEKVAEYIYTKLKSSGLDTELDFVQVEEENGYQATYYGKHIK